MWKRIVRWYEKRAIKAKAKAAEKLGQRSARWRDNDFRELRQHCKEVQSHRAQLAKDLDRKNKECEKLKSELGKLSEENEGLRKDAGRLDLLISDLKIDREHLSHERDKLTNQLEIAKLSVSHMAQIIERDRERVIAEKHVYSALGEKAGM